MEKLSQKLEELQMVFERLSGREKTLVLAMVGMAFVTLAFFGTYFINMSIDSLEDRVQTRKKSYEDILALKNRYDEAKKDIDKVKKAIERNMNTQVTQVIGNLAEENGIAVQRMTQARGEIDRQNMIREVSYRVELRKVELGPLMQMLEGIEKASDLLFVRNITMKRRYNNKSQIDMDFYVSTIVPYETEE